MSAKSRLSSHRAESAPTLFHTALGSVDPVALRLEIPGQHSPDDGYERIIEVMAGLLHERHHWLQHVGTGAGMFISLLLELQGTLIAEIAAAHRLSAADLPLLTNDRFANPLLGWERLEATRRIFFGCRRRDLEDLYQDGRPPLVRQLGPLAHQLMSRVHAGSPEVAGLLDFLLRGGDVMTPNTSVTGESGWILGARHLMEGAARANEVLRLVVGHSRRHYGEGWDGTPLRFDFDGHFIGVYGLARKMFHDVVGQVDGAAQVGFAFACDVALNCPAPPVSPFPLESPGLAFLRVCKALADFPFERTVGIDPAGIRALLGELTEHLRADPEFTDRSYADLDYWATTAGQAFAPLDVDEIAAEMYTYVGDDLPRPLAGGGRLRYLTALSVRAIKLRAQTPELFVFPATLYLDDRKHFHDLFDQIPPPLVAYGDRGIWPTREQDGWLEFFLATGVQAELSRGMVMCNAHELGARLAPFLRSGGGSEHGHLVVRLAIESALGDAPLANDIWRHAVAAADPD